MGSKAFKSLLWLALSALTVNADPATLSFSDCFVASGNNTAQKLSVSAVYGQVLQDELTEPYLNLTVLGTTPEVIQNSANGSSELSTLFTTTSVLTLSVFTNSSKLCQTLRPPSPLQSPGSNFNSSYYCPILSGGFAFTSSIPWGQNRALTTLSTRLSAVDPWGTELICIDVNTTPLSPGPDNPYGAAIAIFWGSVGLAMGYWVLVGIARIVSAWDRGLTRAGRNPWARAQSAGYILASAISGERLATSPALLRFCTPSMRDLIFHAQWCSALAMVAVQWPTFIYPLLTQTAWSTLSYNISITANDRWDPLVTAPYNPPANFSDQLADTSSVLYIDPNAPNLLFTLPDNATDGISSFAYTIGVRPQELFSICLILFLAIVAATIALSLFVWFVDHVVCLITGAFTESSSGPGIKMSGTRSPAFGTKDDGGNTEENKSLNSRDLSAVIRPPSRFALGAGAHSKWRRWLRGRTASSALSSFHGSVLHGNLVRILVLFHLPITIFSVYQMTLPPSVASLSSRVLAGISFAIISCLIPAILVIRVRLTTTNKLYEETRTLLSLGPLYNHYRHGSQMFASLLFATNIAFGLTIGAGQKSGTAQAIIILVVEVLSALVTTVWLPWGTGASMGLISFLFCVARIVIAVLLVILAPAITVGQGAEGWIAYGILIILALIYLAFAIMLTLKIIEALVRIVGGVSFDRSRHSVDSGLLGACGLLGCCGGPRRKSRRRDKRGKSSDRSGYQQAESGLRSPQSELSYPPTIGVGTGKGGSIHSTGPPPSVLKPEHAFRPYKEESDDEAGYIMGAWQPFQNRSTGYIPVGDSTPNAAAAGATAKSSGFSRVGGGRAHIDTPYAIAAAQEQAASGSTHTFPSIEHRGVPNQNANGSSSSLSRPRYEDESPPPSVSSNVALGQRQVHDQSALPPGAMIPFHVRTKSQTAIIEHVDLPVNLLAYRPGSTTPANVSGSRPPSRTNRFESSGSAPPPSSYRRRSGTVESDDESSYGRSKKKWYHLRRNRAHSTEGYTPSDTSPPLGAPTSAPVGDSSSIGTPQSATPGRSFVVIRKQQTSPAKSLQAASSSVPTTPAAHTVSFANSTAGPS
ncbi:hypothetical protein D9757_001130 [Collybiopsis confluens]|uniref:TRP C-terminal domain-containing protein n=1 Tax=Collybiopsis confluens TaxID=2823264 RepID=A0A8H5I1M2_9AGAR|nr:hypothetical protein D9757_001130 [Collybiopsis confluens]